MKVQLMTPECVPINIANSSELKKTRQFGNTEMMISPLGLGGMPLSLSGRPSESQAIETIHRALDLGITLIDTADSYCLNESDKHHNERLIHKALQQYGGDISKITIVTKGGYTRPDGNWVSNGEPDYIRKTIRASFDALGGERPIDLWLYHCPDPSYSLKESLAPAKEALADGIIRSIGVSNFSLEQLKYAREVVDIVAIENQYNIWHRNPEFEGIVDYCEEEGLIFLAWSPLGGIKGKRRTKDLNEIAVLNDLAEQKGVSIYCILLAWLRAKSPSVIPIVGASRPFSIEDSMKSVQFILSNEEIRSIDKYTQPSLLRQFIFSEKRKINEFLKTFNIRSN